jgi:hypothetical protein
MRTRSNRLKRRAPRLAPRPRILVICEGEKTEPGYLNSLRITEKIRLIEIEIVEAAGVPKTIVERAVRKKREAKKRATREGDSSQQYDEVWCVFDVDAHPNLAEALQQAHANEIQVALSNPCFELWVLLHFQNQTAWIDRHAALSACRLYIRNYDKKVSYAETRDRYPEAAARAQALDAQQRRNSQLGENPTTWVYKLTERLLDLSRASLLDDLPH